MTDGAFVATVSRRRTALVVLGAAGFVVLGIFILRDPRARDPYHMAIGLAATVFFALCGVVGVRQLFRTEPVMEIDGRGILWRRWSDERIPWSAFSRAEIGVIRRQRLLSLWLFDPGRYRSTHMLGRLASANKAMGFGDIALSAAGTNRRFEELVEAVDRFGPALRRPAGQPPV